MSGLPRVPVIAAVVLRGDRYLLGRRPGHKRHGGLWEFPGGKLDNGEDWLAAARRELREELGMDALSTGRVLFEIGDPGSRFVIHFVEVEASGEPVALEHAEVGWFLPDEMAGLPLAPADACFVSRLRAEA